MMITHTHPTLVLLYPYMDAHTSHCRRRDVFRRMVQRKNTSFGLRRRGFDSCDGERHSFFLVDTRTTPCSSTEEHVVVTHRVTGSTPVAGIAPFVLLRDTSLV